MYSGSFIYETCQSRTLVRFQKYESSRQPLTFDWLKNNQEGIVPNAERLLALEWECIISLLGRRRGGMHLILIPQLVGVLAVLSSQ